MTDLTDLFSALPDIVPEKSRDRRKVVNVVMLGLMGCLTVVALIPLIWIIVYVFAHGFKYLSPAFFTQLPRPLGMEGGGVLNAIEGTFILTIIGGVIAIPPAIFAAIYAANKPNTPLGVMVRFSTDVLSGIPSIITGLFCYSIIVKPQGHYSALAGGIALAIIMFPIITRTTEEMIKLVPRTLREGSLALGAPDWRTHLSVIIPAALSGIVTGILLGLARASGETAPLLFTALGNERYDFISIIRSGIAGDQSVGMIINRVIEQPVDSLSLTLFKYSQQPYPERVNQAWAVAFILMALVLILNIITRLWVNWRAARLRG